MTNEEVAKLANEAAADMCAKLLEKFGPDRDYFSAVGMAASTILYHVHRIGAPEGKSIQLLQAVLDDVAENIGVIDKRRISFRVVEQL